MEGIAVTDQPTDPQVAEQQRLNDARLIDMYARMDPAAVLRASEDQLVGQLTVG
jgi:hypothetical protein